MIYKITPPSNMTETRVALPSSKSLSNRALIINALSPAPGVINNLADCDDTAVMMAALRGVSAGSDAVIDVHGSGTAMRFLTAFLALRGGCATITGSERMQNRPISILVDALRMLGADISYVSRDGFPPLSISGSSMHGGTLSMPASISSQYISALMMIAPLLKGGLTINLLGHVASRPYISMTASLMRLYGAEVDDSSYSCVDVKEGKYLTRNFKVENDWSAASYWYEILALMPPASIKITLEGLSSNSMQGDSKVSHYFKPLGIVTKHDGDTVTLRRTGSKKPERLKLDLCGEPDLALTLVATCCGLGVKFTFSGLDNLRVKETNRIAALEAELAKAGFVLSDDGAGVIEWNGQRCEPTKPAVMATYADHRMAMSLAPLCIPLGEIYIADPDVVKKSYRNYWLDLAAAGFGVEEIKH